MPAIVALTVANGGDNVGAYTPLFRTIGRDDLAATLVVFAAGVALWCAAGSWLAARAKLARVVEERGEWIVPVVFIAIGGCIVLKVGAP